MSHPSGHLSTMIGAVCGLMMVLFAFGFIISEFIRFRRRKTPGYTGFISMRSTTRRISGSFILAGLGLLFYLGLSVIDFSDSPVLFTVFWMVCSFLAFFLFLLGLLDFREVRTHQSAHQLRLLWRMTRDIPRKD